MSWLYIKCGNFAFPVVTAYKNLSVLRTVDDNYYSIHVANIVHKARRLVGSSLKGINSRKSIYLLNNYLSY